MKNNIYLLLACMPFFSGCDEPSEMVKKELLVRAYDAKIAAEKDFLIKENNYKKLISDYESKVKDQEEKINLQHIEINKLKIDLEKYMAQAESRKKLFER